MVGTGDVEGVVFEVLDDAAVDPAGVVVVVVVLVVVDDVDAVTTATGVATTGPVIAGLFAGGLTTTGTIGSGSIRIVNDAELVRPKTSGEVVHVTVVTPNPKLPPDAGTQVAVPAETLGFGYVTTAPEAVSASRRMLAGTVIVGAGGFTTVIVKVLVVVWFKRSVVEHVTVVGPSANTEPDAGRQVGVPALAVGAV